LVMLKNALVYILFTDFLGKRDVYFAETSVFTTKVETIPYTPGQALKATGG
jgi:hypothetical protein